MSVRHRTAEQNQKRGLIFALRSNGATLKEIGDVIGLSRERIRALDKMSMREIERVADRRFPLARGRWADYVKPAWLADPNRRSIR